MNSWNSIDVYSLVCGIACCCVARGVEKIFDWLLDIFKEILFFIDNRKKLKENVGETE